MRLGDSWRNLASSDLGVLVLLGIAEVLLYAVTNGQYGFHRDELATLDDARSLAWGYVAYPPLTPFLARIAFLLFGPSLIGFRFIAAVALGLVLVLTDLMARHLRGGRQAQIVAALAAAIGGVAFSAGTLFPYVSFDYLWCVRVLSNCWSCQQSFRHRKQRHRNTDIFCATACGSLGPCSGRDFSITARAF